MPLTGSLETNPNLIYSAIHIFYSSLPQHAHVMELELSQHESAVQELERIMKQSRLELEGDIGSSGNSSSSTSSSTKYDDHSGDSSDDTDSSENS